MSETWDRYTPSSFKEIISLHKEAVEEDSSEFTLSAAQFPSRVKVKYAGRYRPVSSDKKNIITYYFKSIISAESNAELFFNEYLFYEETTEYWLPVQDQVSKRIDGELSYGDIVHLYCMWLGAIRRNKNTEWIFLVNAFEVEA